MLFTANISSLDRFTLITVTGPVTLEKIVALHSYLANDIAYLHNPSVIWDFSASQLSIDLEQLDISKFYLDKEEMGMSGKTALIIDEDENETQHHNLVSLFKQVSEGLPIQVGDFERLQSAVIWIAK